MRQDERRLLEVLYREYYIPLRQYASSLGVRNSELEDLVHEAFIAYYERYPLDWPEENKKKLLVTILHNKWVDLCRRRNRGYELEQEEAWERQSMIMEETASFLGHLRSPEEWVLSQEFCREVWELIRDMKKSWREVLSLHLVEGLSIREISGILEISEAVCRSRLSRGKRELRKKLGKAEFYQNDIRSSEQF